MENESLSLPVKMESDLTRIFLKNLALNENYVGGRSFTTKRYIKTCFSQDSLIYENDLLPIYLDENYLKFTCLTEDLSQTPAVSPCFFPL